MNSPPFQLPGPGGKPAGLSVDLVREAARRRGITLQWIYWSNSSESALRTKAVDLWPLITITPDRLKAFHISQPFLDFEYALLVRADKPYYSVQDLATATIGLANPTIDAVHLRRRLPHAIPLPRPLVRTVMEDVCENRADAAFMDSYTAIASFLAGRACPGQPIRWIAVPEVRSRLGIGATFENRAVADALRDEIAIMADQGKLGAILGRWGYLSGQHLESMEALLTSRRRENRLTVAAALFALLFMLACWQMLHITRQRNRTRLAERYLRDAEQKLRLMADNLREMVLAYDMERRVIYANSSVETLTGYTLADLEKTGFSWFHDGDRARMALRWDSLFQGGAFQDEEYRLVTRQGAVKWVEATWGPILDATGRQVGVQGSERDISARKAAEEALRESQQRYLQAQKLESVGRLAGGVAHDFNNLLTVINGYSDLVLRRLGDAHPLREDIAQIRNAGTRAADLTRQLLMFSRKQLIQPRSVDLNQVVVESEKMLRRVLGEDIQLTTSLNPSLGLVLADPGQLHQVLMNLVVNARDAMPDGGTLALETAVVNIDASYTADHPESAAGPFVLLTVTDSGTGMDEETCSHVFEPFFSTKDQSHGSGLGLSTVYGIVRQSKGWVEIYTELGVGSEFKVYLPRIQAEVQMPDEIVPSPAALRGSETVLVVEDQEEVRCLATTVLTGYGYQVLQAADGAVALALVGSHSGPIDLLLTDVVLPGMNGRELSESLRRLLPSIKVLYTSGYTYEVIAHRGVIAREVAYIAKPYSPAALAAKVRQVLSSPHARCN